MQLIVGLNFMYLDIGFEAQLGDFNGVFAQNVPCCAHTHRLDVEFNASKE
uniref:Uncharacterized protein n=1 Tax=Physcomitrium patens TaxID=3218 RepID=A0A2K1L3T0_PHYPA|nr:hypothetical protein PHYPA_003477 [Physcomitrium patens]